MDYPALPRQDQSDQTWHPQTGAESRAVFRAWAVERLGWSSELNRSSEFNVATEFQRGHWEWLCQLADFPAVNWRRCRATYFPTV